MHYLVEFIMFFAKTLTIALTILMILLGFIAIIAKAKQKGKQESGSLEIKNKNNHYKKLQNKIQQETLPSLDLKVLLQNEKKERKSAKKNSKKKISATTDKKNIFIIKFSGDIRASAVNSLTQEISAILLTAKQEDEVCVILESGGGMVHHYGLAANQLQRIRDAGLQLTIMIDRIAASGGYMMAAVANKIIAAPFAIIGSIGVIAQIPNFHRWLEKHDVDFEQLTAGKYKRTLTMLGKNDDAGREKMQQDIEQTHQLFINFIKKFRGDLDIDKVATGEYWYGNDAINLGLIDEINNSEDWLLKQHPTANLYNITYQVKQKLSQRLSGQIKNMVCHLNYKE